jgi:hypothetical protein
MIVDAWIWGFVALGKILEIIGKFGIIVVDNLTKSELTLTYQSRARK